MSLRPFCRFRFTLWQLAHCTKSVESNRVCFLSCVQNTATWNCDVVIGTATSYWVYGPQLESPQWPKFVSSSKPLWPILLFNGYGLFPGGETCWRVNSTTHLQLVPRLRVSASLHLLLQTFMAWPELYVSMGAWGSDRAQRHMSP